MTQNEMISNIAGKCNVTPEEARAALEAGEWNALTAAQLLENEKLRRMQEVEEVASGCATATAQAPADEPAGDVRTEAVERIESAGASAKAGRTERAGARGRNRGQGLRNLGEHIRRLVACGNRNRLVVCRNDATLLELPVTVAALLMLFAFWTCVPLLVIGLFLGCRYSFRGRDFERAAEYMRKTAADA
ncbi:MAG: DUF4342 domain-containing protein [Clostridia bacterium]|nr:DUF4342 domain-containing protein [Clostridia bacterium]